jgi:hypothetical protein
VQLQPQEDEGCAYSMSVSVTTNHLCRRNPRGGVEDVAAMAAAGFGAVFCNIGDHSPDEWSTVRARASAAGVVCGPWLRTTTDGTFDFDRFRTLLEVADAWGSPLIVNSESEIQGSGTELTTYIDAQLGGRDAAVSMEPWPFDNVGWWPLAKRPMLPQLSRPSMTYTERGLRDAWHAYGIECVVLTFGAFGGGNPSMYDRLAPFGVYTADDCGGQYASWLPLGAGVPCETPPPSEGRRLIGTQDGVDATCNRLRDQDPAGTIMVKDTNGKWPPLSSLDGIPLSKWRAYDKLQRALTILVEDHDAG